MVMPYPDLTPSPAMVALHQLAAADADETLLKILVDIATALGIHAATMEARSLDEVGQMCVARITHLRRHKQMTSIPTPPTHPASRQCSDPSCACHD